jgi:hypothetical protein
MGDEMAPESSDEENDSNVILAAQWGWDQASDGTLLQRSRRSEDTENPHWSPQWGGWGFTEAYLNNGHRSYSDDLDEPDFEMNSLNEAVESGTTYPRNFPRLTAHSSDYSPGSDYPSQVRCTGHQTFVTRMANKDDETCDTEDESEVSLERIDAPRSMRTVTATEPADFFEECWQTREYIGEHLFKDYDDWFPEDNDVYDADGDDDADDDDDGSDFRLGD